MKIPVRFLIIILLFCSKTGAAQKFKGLDSLQEIISHSNDSSAVAIALVTFGDRIFFSYPDSAITIFNRAENLITKIISNPRSSASDVKSLKYYLAAINGDRGSIYLQQGRIADALNCYSRSIKIDEEIENIYGLAGNLNNIGLIYENNLNDTERALGYYQRALKLSGELGKKFRWFNAIVLSNLAGIYKKQGNIPLALQYNSLSGSIHSAVNNKSGLAYVAKLNAQIFKDQGHIQKAIRYGNKSLNLSKDAGDLETYASTLLFLGDIYYALEDLDKATELASLALKIARKNNYLNEVVDAAFLLQKIYTKQKRWEEVADMYTLYFLIRDSLENNEMKTKVIRDLVYYENENRTLEDSLKNITEQVVKDTKIRKQDEIINKQTEFRNLLIIGLLILASVSFILLNRYRLNVKNKQNQFKIYSLETEQKLLRAQMNPHFINNALNSIQSLILENEPAEAGEYLVTFSRLTRAILEQTRKKYISLNKEMETLRMYLEMERLRFDNKFDYEISLSENLIPENIYIPPLLIQPFVENSILHGIVHKNGTGTISIAFNRVDGNLKCIIQDDGIGRKMAKEINKNKSRSGDSVATQIAIERLSLMNQNSSIEFEDLMDDQQHATGTRVIINMPFNNQFDDSSNH
jgi:tetratricopeptide (TPR) repeat protein